MKASANLNLPCRRCARGPVQCIQPSRRGAYLRCAACGHIWQEGGLLLTRRRPATSPRRRRSDAIAGDHTPLDTGAAPPADCGLQCVEGGQTGAPRSIQDLAQRIAQLEEENRNLREAARAFGELAERLSKQLRADQEPPEGT